VKRQSVTSNMLYASSLRQTTQALHANSLPEEEETTIAKPISYAANREDWRLIKRNPQSHRLGCEQQHENESGLAWQLKSHESNCSVCVI